MSCNCTEAYPLHYTLAPGQETAIIATMNSRHFDGMRAVTIYVDFAEPSEEVRLAVQANSRVDLRFAPETLNFDKIKYGAAPSKQIEIAFYGQPQVQVTDIRCDSNFIQPKVKELRRNGTEVVFQVATALRPDIPSGKWYTDIWLSTNSPSMPRLRVPLSVEVEPAPTTTQPPTTAQATPITPPPVQPAPPPTTTTPPQKPAQNVALKPVKVGTQSEQQVILRSEQPFRITGVEGAEEDQQLVVQPVSDERKTIHVLTLIFRPSQPGQINRTIRVHTDLATNRDIEFNAQAQVLP